MSQLACPLCGRFVSLNGFDPSHFESDIYAVNRTGLGRGRGFAVSESFSVLGDLTITGPIAARCRIILGLIEGREIPRLSVTMRLNMESLNGEDCPRQTVTRSYPIKTLKIGTCGFSHVNAVSRPFSLTVSSMRTFSTRVKVIRLYRT